jgi:ABC-type transport system involved in multi-copper enzyme maturation permease subunit
MSAFWAIVEDTWRQSKQQIVFLLLLGVMGLLALGAVALPKVSERPQGGSGLVLWFQDDPTDGFEAGWDERYRQAIAEEQRHEDKLREPRRRAMDARQDFLQARQRVAEARLRAAPAEQQRPLEEALEKAKARADQEVGAYEDLQRDLQSDAQAVVDQRAGGITPLRKGVEVWLATWAALIFTVSMWGFIAAAAGYYPGMLQAGAVDVLVAKPVGRIQIFLGKYVGGLVLYGAALVAAYLVIFLGIGLRTGEWHLQFFSAIPLTLYAVALLYALVAWVGVFTRRTALAIVLGYVFYFVIDTAVGALQWIGNVPMLQGVDWLSTISEWSRLLFPGFSRLKTAASASVVNVPIFEWQPILVGLVWLALLLGTAHWRFKKLDF